MSAYMTVPPHVARWKLDKMRGEEETKQLELELPRPTIFPDERDVERRKEHGNHDGDGRDTNRTQLEFGSGGGTPAPPQQPDPMAEARAQDWANQQSFERQEVIRKEEANAKAAEKAAKDAAWATGRSSAYNRAQSYGNERLNALGLEANDPYGLGTAYRSRLESANAGLQEGGDYASAFSPNNFDEVMGGARTAQRNKYSSSFNKAVDPYYGETIFGSTADDAILASILGDQYNEALSDITASRDRGQVNQSVYDRAIADLGKAKTTANDELQSIGGGVLSGLQADIGKRRQSALDAAAEWDFGGSYDPTQEADRIQKYGQEQLSGLGGKLRSAIGERSFFDVPGLIGKASAKAGSATTPKAGGTLDDGTSALSNTFQNAAQKEQEGTF